MSGSSSFKTWSKVCSASVAVLLASQTAAAQVDSSRIDAIVRTEMAQQRVPGVAVAVIKNGDVVIAKGYGSANLEHNVPVTPDTLFQSGSLGKQFTAAAVMSLVDDGTIALSDPITKYFPEAPDEWRAITVRHLLTHTAGVPDFTFETADVRRDRSEEDRAHEIFRLNLEFPAGSRWMYSNRGYQLLGVLIRRASGRFYGDVLRERVFVPLGMKTARVISEEDVIPHRAAGYRLVNGDIKNQQWVSPTANTTADGSLYFSLLDLIAWDRGLRAKAVLRPESWAQVFSPVQLNSGRTFPYGFGWYLAEVAGQKVERHGGRWQGFTSYLARYRGDDLTIVMLGNLAQANPAPFVEGIAAGFNSKLARTEPTPVPDREPGVTARLGDLLGLAADGRLTPGDFAYVRTGFFPTVAGRYTELLKGLSTPQRIDLIERFELGDDRMYRYQVRYATVTLEITLGLAADDKISAFEIRLR